MNKHLFSVAVLGAVLILSGCGSQKSKSAQTDAVQGPENEMMAVSAAAEQTTDAAGLAERIIPMQQPDVAKPAEPVYKEPEINIVPDEAVTTAGAVTDAAATVTTVATAGLPSDYTEYTVRKGQTLSHIAQEVYGKASKWTVVYEANKDKLSDPSKLSTGMVLRIPKAETVPQAAVVEEASQQ